MLEEMKYVCAPWHPAISWKIGLWVCWAVEKKNPSLELHHFAYRSGVQISSSELFLKPLVVSLTVQETIFQLQTPISNRILGVANYTTIRTIWVTGYTTNFENEATIACQTQPKKMVPQAFPIETWCFFVRPFFNQEVDLQTSGYGQRKICSKAKPFCL